MQDKIMLKDVFDNIMADNWTVFINDSDVIYNIDPLTARREIAYKTFQRNINFLLGTGI